jgi:hypothetical protein
MDTIRNNFPFQLVNKMYRSGAVLAIRNNTPCARRLLRTASRFPALYLLTRY